MDALEPVEPLGIHHVTAVAADPQRNIDFYHEVLGLRLVKTTVNFDWPETYHLYYGDEVGHPGTILTFFPWPDRPPGRRGAGQATTTAFSIPEAAVGWWEERLASKGVAAVRPATRLDEEALSFEDPDGLLIELVAHTGTDPRPPWESGPIAADHAIRGLHSMTMTEAGPEPTVDLLTGTLGFRLVAEEGDRLRFEVGEGGPGAQLDVVSDPGADRGEVNVGTVHHVAWRAPDDETQVAWRQQIVERGLDVTPVIDRQYFRSIYFREPGGVLLEIATDAPGFLIDEPVGDLGCHLKLPPWLEPRRDELAAALPPLEPPSPPD
ncbi:MAG: ring-cleaving dioxygenase [Acidimicrobiales bacterium]